MEAGGEPGRRRTVLGHGFLERRVESALAEPRGLGLVEDAEPRVHSGGDRMRRAQAPAEAVDGHDPRPLALARRARDLPRPLGVAALGGVACAPREQAPDPLAKLAGRALREGERQDRSGPTPSSVTASQ